MNVQLGFSTGCFYKTKTPLVDILHILRKKNVRVVELGFVKLDAFRSGELDILTEADLSGFDHISLHTPTFNYGDHGTEEIFEQIRRINDIRPLDLAVFHPDTIIDFSIFRDPGFAVAFENMDNRKTSHQTVTDLAAALAHDERIGFVLDVNHVFTNDPSMTLAAEFYATLGHRIREIHLSGYTGYHEPLFQTRQRQIIAAIQEFSVPIVVESVLDFDGIEQERDFILQTAAKR